jgi:hypothetical protein
MSDLINVLVKRPGEPAYVVTCPAGALVEIIGGFPQRFPAPLRQSGFWLIDGEGHTKGLAPNVESLGHVVLGPIVWLSRTLGGLDERELRAGLRWFARQPEIKGEDK